MIRNEQEYRDASRRCLQDKEVAEKQKLVFEEKGFNSDEIELLMQPLQSFHAQLSDEITWYENVKRRNIDPTKRLTDLGRILIALRIANGLTQTELAGKLGVSEASVSRDERNEYHGVTLERAQRILDALNETIISEVTPRDVYVQDDREAVTT